MTTASTEKLPREVLSAELSGNGGVHPILLTRRVSAAASWSGVVDEEALKKVAGDGCTIRIAARTFNLSRDTQRNSGATCATAGATSPDTGSEENNVVFFRLLAAGQNFSTCRCGVEAVDPPAISVAVSAPSDVPLNVCLEGNGTLELAEEDRARFQVESITIGTRPATSSEPGFRRFAFRIPPFAFGTHTPDVEVQLPVRVELRQQGSPTSFFADAGTLDFRTAAPLAVPLACD